MGAFLVLAGATVAVAVVTLSGYPAASRSGGMTWTAVLFGLAILVGAGMALWLSHGLLKALAGVTGVLRQLAGGERTARAPVVGFAECRELADAVNCAAEGPRSV